MISWRDHFTSDELKKFDAASEASGVNSYAAVIERLNSQKEIAAYAPDLLRSMGDKFTPKTQFTIFSLIINKICREKENNNLSQLLEHISTVNDADKNTIESAFHNLLDYCRDNAHNIGHYFDFVDSFLLSTSAGFSSSKKIELSNITIHAFEERQILGISHELDFLSDLGLSTIETRAHLKALETVDSAEGLNCFEAGFLNSLNPLKQNMALPSSLKNIKQLLDPLTINQGIFLEKGLAEDNTNKLLSRILLQKQANNNLKFEICWLIASIEGFIATLEKDIKTVSNETNHQSLNQAYQKTKTKLNNIIFELDNLQKALPEPIAEKVTDQELDTIKRSRDKLKKYLSDEMAIKRSLIQSITADIDIHANALIDAKKRYLKPELPKISRFFANMGWIGAGTLILIPTVFISAPVAVIVLGVAVLAYGIVDTTKEVLSHAYDVRLPQLGAPAKRDTADKKPGFFRRLGTRLLKNKVAMGASVIGLLSAAVGILPLFIPVLATPVVGIPIFAVSVMFVGLAALGVAAGTLIVDALKERDEKKQAPLDYAKALEGNKEAIKQASIDEPADKKILSSTAEMLLITQGHNKVSAKVLSQQLKQQAVKQQGKIVQQQSPIVENNPNKIIENNPSDKIDDDPEDDPEDESDGVTP